MKNSVQEKIVTLIKKEAERSLVFWNKNNYIEDAGEMCDDFAEIVTLCDKILTYDYFEKSESIIDNWLNSENLSKYGKMCDDWFTLYRKNVKLKRKDLNKLFKLVADRIEDFENV